MGMFDDIEGAQVSKSGNYLEPGHYKVTIDAVKSIDSKKESKKFIIIEMTVLKSDNPNIKVGGEYSQVIDTSKVMFLPNMKIFMAAISGVDPNSEKVNEEVTAYWTKVLGAFVSFSALCEMVVTEENPLGGTEMDLICRLTKTSDGGDFTKHLWQPRDIG